MDAPLAWSFQSDSGFAVESDSGFVEELWVLGQPPLDRYLRNARDAVTIGAKTPCNLLVDEWRAANDYYYDLEEQEAGFVDHIEIRDIDPALRPLADEVSRDARFRRAFDALPTRFAMVEIDRLIVSQAHVDLTHARRLQTRLGACNSSEDLFRFCLPINGSEAPVHTRPLGSKRFLFWSRSSDFRFHEAALLEPDQICGHVAYGSLGRVLGLMVGYGSNFLNAIQSENRLMLSNGHHRAYALREMGITHAACIVSSVTRRDELKLVASSDTAANPGFYFKAPRPPLFKDFFDPKLRKILKVPRLLRAVEVTFETKQYEVRDFRLAD
jgi:hypothetical protein